MTPAEFFLLSETFARALRRPVPSAIPTVEFILCGLLAEGEATRRFWCDGVLVDEVIGGFEAGLALGGRAWIALCGRSAKQWQVPIRMELELSPVEPDRIEHIRLLLGDADLGTLDAHAGAHRNVPERWLLRFDLPRPAPPARPATDDLVAQVVVWAAGRPGRPIVGPEWQPLSLDAAADHIRAEVASDRVVVIEEIWLDGGDALRLA